MEEAMPWEELEMLVDSGASASVVGDDMVKAVSAIHVKPNVSYQMADGSYIPHMGEKAFRAYTDEGLLRHMAAQLYIRRTRQSRHSLIETVHATQ